MIRTRIFPERIYDDISREGYRVLADGLWPRGISRKRAALDEWCKALAPTPGLRKWFGHRPERWQEFRRRYERELRDQKAEAQALLQRAGDRDLILLYAARDKEHAHVLVLKKYLEDEIQGNREKAGHAPARTTQDAGVDMASPVCYAADLEDGSG